MQRCGVLASRSTMALPCPPVLRLSRSPPAVAAHPADSRTEEYSHQLAKVLREGRNRCVRRMTAYVGHPPRDYLLAYGHYTLNGLTLMDSGARSHRSRTDESISLLLLYWPTPLSAVDAASFDCQKAVRDEKAICAHPSLNDKDVGNAHQISFLKGLFAMGSRGALAGRPAERLKTASAVQGRRVTCPTKAYNERLKTA